jgi:hypothetical protein
MSAETPFHYDRAFSRNYGFGNEAEQEAVHRSVVSIAGAGGDGFQLGYKLAMKGVGEIRVADPEAFERENSNRVFGATTENVGRNKATAFKDMVDNLGRGTKVVVYEDGVTEENVHEFMLGSDLVLDESELRYLNVGTMISREAIKLGIPEMLVLNVGYAGVVTSFKSEPGAKSFQDLMGVSENTPLSVVANTEVAYSRAIPYIPHTYGHINTFMEVTKGAPLPSISEGVDAASAIGTAQAFLHLTRHLGNKRPSPTWAPKYAYMDAYTHKAGTIHFPRTSHYVGVGLLAARSKLGMNPEASYSEEDRARRATTIAESE